jgi:hypothetical protein
MIEIFCTLGYTFNSFRQSIFGSRDSLIMGMRNLQDLSTQEMIAQSHSEVEMEFSVWSLTNCNRLPLLDSVLAGGRTLNLTFDIRF